MAIFAFLYWLCIVACSFYVVKIDNESYKIIKEMAVEVDNLRMKVKVLEHRIDILEQGK